MRLNIQIHIFISPVKIYTIRAIIILKIQLDAFYLASDLARTF